MPTTDNLKKTTIDRIKVAAPLTVGMLSVLVERLLISESIELFSIEWFCSVFSFFSISTFIVAGLMYNYKLLDHSCPNCLNRWVSIQADMIIVSHSILKINFIKKYLLFRIERKFKTYSCKICNNTEHKQSTEYTFIGTESKN